jgi:hypothetical protein
MHRKGGVQYILYRCQNLEVGTFIVNADISPKLHINPLAPSDPYMGR